MISCSWTDFDADEMCGEDAHIHWCIPLCDEHIKDYEQSVAYRVERAFNPAIRHHGLGSFPGFCYFVLLPDGAVKIGCSSTKVLLERRFRDISRDAKGPIVELLVIPGGYVAEAVMHGRFREDRLPGTGERFRYSPAIAQFIEDTKAGKVTGHGPLIVKQRENA